MSQANLEHANVTVSDPHKTAAWMRDVFGWSIRWEGAALNEGYTIHVGSDISYLALYAPKSEQNPGPRSYVTTGALNHIAVTVDDIDTAEAKVRNAGFTPHSHGDYEPGRRFYFDDHDGVEFEVVQY